MSYLHFENLGAKILQSKGLFDYSEWPEILYAPKQEEEYSTGIFFSKKRNIFWHHIHEMRSATDVAMKDFSEEYQGSTGWEYSMIMGFLLDKFYYSKYHSSKNYGSVTSSHNFKIDSEFKYESQECKDKVIVDDRIVDTIFWPNTEALYKRNKLIHEGLFSPIFISNFHTHPLVLYPKLGKSIYTFFSLTDMRSLMDSNMYITGLITDKVWLACKSTSSSLPGQLDLLEVTKAELYEPDSFESKASEVMRSYGIVLYVANFNGGFRRVN